MAGKKFFILLVVLFPFYVFGSQTEADYIHSIEYVEKLNQKYPELFWFADNTIDPSEEENSISMAESWSKKIFNQYYPEYDRTVLSIISLHLIRIGDYNAYKYFIKSQSIGKKLRFKNFQKLSMRIQELQKWDPKIITALETALVLRDVGKTSIEHEKISQLHLDDPNHALSYSQAVEKYSYIFPSFKTLSLKHQNLLKQEANIMHYGHFSHLEGGPEMLIKIEKSNFITKKPWIFDFSLLLHLCNIAGSAGHVSPLGARELNEETFKLKHLLRQSVLQLKYKSRQEVLKYFIVKRAKLINQPLNSSKDYLIVRIAALLRITTPEYTEKFNAAFANLSQNDKNIILEEFYPLTERNSNTPTNISAVLLNLFHNKAISKNENDRINYIFNQGLSFIATILHEYRHNQSNVPYNENLTLNFNEIARIAKKDPFRLTVRNYEILKSGVVVLMNKDAEKPSI